MKTTSILRLAFLAVFAICFVPQVAFSVPAYPHPINYVLPDGSEITIQLRGDEWVNWAVSSDGYTLLFNQEGYLEYAVHNEWGDLKLSGVRARNEPERSSEERNFVAKQRKGIGYSLSQAETIRRFYDIGQEAVRKRTVGISRKSATETVRIPVILVQFPGKPFVRTKEDFELLLNQLNYAATSDGPVTGSLRDYFLATSYGQLDVQFDVFGPVTVAQSIGFYDHRSSGGEPRAMVQEAALLAHALGCDFSNYDSDNIGFVDCLHLFYAGYGQEAGAPIGQSIWAHAWSLSGNFALELNGKQIRRYSVSSELRGTSGSNITFIGVLAHELGHSLLGLPDFYDTGGERNIDIGSWCLMASGSWLDGGRTPSRLSAWARDFVGWTPAIELSDDATITLPNPVQEDAIYRINTTTSNEYFLIENRQRQGWDAFIPASGMLIYHVDRNHPGWNNNCINCNHARRGYYVKQAGGGISSNSTERANDPYPITGNTSFTDYTQPNARSWTNAFTNTPVTNITHNTTERTISFNFEVTDPEPPNITTDTLPSGVRGVEYREPLSATGFTPMTWVRESGSFPQGLSISSSGGVISGTPTMVGTFSFTVSVTNAGGSDTASFTIYISANTSAAEVLQTSSLKGWMENDILQVRGLTIGRPWYIYSVSGTLVYQSIATMESAEVQLRTFLPAGTYIIRSENKSTKIIF